MSNLTRWEPFGELMSMRKNLDRLFEDAFSRPLALEGQGIPSMDMYQTERDVIVRVTLPGLKPEDIDIKVTGEVLNIRGEIKQEEEVEKATYHLRERRYGSFTRSVTLPVNVVADKAKAEFENGILNLTLPKAEEVLPKVIEVKAKSK
jgi:HSP20 family protein